MLRLPGASARPFTRSRLKPPARNNALPADVLGAASRDLRPKKMSSRPETGFVVTKLVISVHLHGAARRGSRTHGNRQNDLKRS